MKRCLNPRLLRAVVLMVGFAVCAAASAQRSVPVTVVNEPSAPVPVAPQGMEGIPVQASAIVVLPTGEFSGLADLYTPPLGKLLIVEYLTLQIDSRADEQAIILLSTRTDGATVNHALGPLPPGVVTGLGSGRTQMLQRNLRAYSDGLVRFIYTRGTGLDGERAIVQVTLAGRLVDDPAP